jgi:hypothetical protein
MRYAQIVPHARTARVDDLAQREGASRVDLRHMRQRRQPFLVDALVVLEVLGRRCAGYSRIRPTSGGRQHVVIVLARHQGQQRFTAASNSVSVFSNWPESEMCTIAVILCRARLCESARDSPGPRPIFENVEPARAGRLRQADLLGERGIGDPAVLLKCIQNGDIDLSSLTLLNLRISLISRKEYSTTACAFATNFANTFDADVV